MRSRFPYEGLTIEEAFTITVNAVEAVSLEIVELPAKTEYLVGETLDLTGVVLLLSYNNGDAKAFSMTDAEVKLIGCEAGVLDHTGSFELTFEVEGVKTQEAVIIRVLSAEVSRIEIVEMPENLDYTVGDELNLTGGVIRVFYNNGETGDIAMNDAQIKLIGCDTGVLNSVGEFTVSVEFAGYQSPNSFVVTVKAPYVVAVEIEEEPARYQFGLEDKIHFGEGTLKLIYNNGSEEIISMNDARVACAGLGEDVLSADAILLQEGQFEVRFAVDGIETEGAFAFEVLHAKKVAITAMPEHKAFHLGDDIDLTGGIITVELEDGTIKEVDMNDPNAIKHVLKLQEMDLSDITEPSVYEVRFEYRGLMADESIILTIVPQGEDLPEEDVTPDDGDVDDDGNDDVTPDDGDVDDDVTDDVIPDDGDDEDGETPDDGDVDDTTPDDGDEDVTDDATPDDGDVDDDVEDDVTPDDGDVEDGDVDDTTPDDGDDDEITDDVTPDNGDVDDDTKDDEVLGDVAGDVTDSDDADVEDEVLVDVEDPAAAADGELTEGETESTIAEIITAISENPATGIIAITGGMILALIGGAVVVIRKLK